MSNTNHKKELNIFFLDSTSFISKADELVKPKMLDNDAILASLLASLGIEKILKGILWEINPIYIFAKTTFEESSEALYSGLYVEEKKSKDIIDPDTITFKTAIQRSKFFSKTVTSHFSLLYKLANIRNKIAHNICSLSDRNFIRPFLLKEFRPLIKEFCEELKFRKNTFFNAFPVIISRYENEKEEQEISLEEEISNKLKKHLLIWKKRKKDVTFIHNKESLTNNSIDITKNVIIKCPACSNNSLLYYEPDFEYSDGQSILIGFYVTCLSCLFCDLYIIDYDEIDHFNLDHLLKKLLENRS